MHHFLFPIFRIVFLTAFVLIIKPREAAGQHLRKWEFRATGEWNIRTKEIEYSYNMMFGIGAQIERYFGRWIRANTFSSVHRSFPNEPGGRVYVRRLSFGGTILIMDRKKFPVGLQIGTGWNYYWAKFPQVEINNLLFEKRTDKFMYPMTFIGLLGRVNERIEGFINYCRESTPPFHDGGNNFIQIGIRYRWAKGKSDSPSTETHENAR